jgi:hypothetical protein
MLLIDGVKYDLWTPPSEDDLEQMVKEHAQDIFGEQSIYLDIKPKLKSKSGIGSIPDGYVIVFGGLPCWHIVEVELSSHPLYEHIVQQVSRFINGIKNFNIQREITDAIYEEINKDELLKLKVRRAIEPIEIHRFLSEVISKPPVVTIIIEKHTEGLDEALSTLAHTQIKVVEFQTFVRYGVGLGAHAHLFEPLYAAASFKPPQPVQTPPPPIVTRGKRFTIRDLISAGLIRPGQRLFKTYKGKRYEAEIMAGGQLRLLHDNTEWNTLSGASDHITNTSTDGWEWWYTVINGQQCLMDDLRKRLKGE